MQNDNNFNIVIGNIEGQANFGTEDIPGQVFKEFPPELHILESCDFLSYEKVWDHLFTDKFFDLTPAILDNMHMEAANQRCVFSNSADMEAEHRIYVTISLPGRMAPNEKLHLLQNATAAGYTIEPIRLHGMGCSIYSEITISKDPVNG